MLLNLKQIIKYRVRDSELEPQNCILHGLERERERQ